MPHVTVATLNPKPHQQRALVPHVTVATLHPQPHQRRALVPHVTVATLNPKPHQRRALMPHVTVATAVSHLGKIFHNRLVEDVGSCTVSYTDFLCKIHVSIQRALSLT
jgi:phenylpyruvate tautomerase PptA (4-oxalocrotonate tautomerase family)